MALVNNSAIKVIAIAVTFASIGSVALGVRAQPSNNEDATSCNRLGSFPLDTAMHRASSEIGRTALSEYFRKPFGEITKQEVLNVANAMLECRKSNPKFFSSEGFTEKEFLDEKNGPLVQMVLSVYGSLDRFASGNKPRERIAPSRRTSTYFSPNGGGEYRDEGSNDNVPIRDESPAKLARDDEQRRIVALQRSELAERFERQLEALIARKTHITDNELAAFNKLNLDTKALVDAKTYGGWVGKLTMVPGYEDWLRRDAEQQRIESAERQKRYAAERLEESKKEAAAKAAERDAKNDESATMWMLLSRVAELCYDKSLITRDEKNRATYISEALNQSGTAESKALRKAKVERGLEVSNMSRASRYELKPECDSLRNTLVFYR